MPDQDQWPAPSAGRPVDATVDLPGSKSLTARYCVLAALAAGPSTIAGALLARDTRLMVRALATLGAEIHIKVPSTKAERPGQPGCAPVIDITPGPIHGNAKVDCGLAGTVMRFVPPIAALADTPVAFDGDPAARLRPLAPLLATLRELGVRVEDGGRGHLPVTIHGHGGVDGGDATVDASTSSQFASALLLAAPRFSNGLSLTNSGSTLPSKPHIDMTLAALRAFGAQASASPADANPIWQVSGQLTGREMTVEPDLSNAGPFLAAALVTGGRVRLPAWPRRTTQAGDLLRDYLAAFGALVLRDASGLTVEAGVSGVKGADLDLSPAGELVPTLAAIALFADSPTVLRNIAHLRGHETNRLAALVNEIKELGGCAHETADGLVIEPKPLHAALLESYGDHRMATFGAIVGLRVPGVTVRDISCTGKTLPDFPARWQRLLGARA